MQKYWPICWPRDRFLCVLRPWLILSLWILCRGAAMAAWEDDSNTYVPRKPASASKATSRSSHPIPVLPGPHLLIDDYLIESSNNLARSVQVPQRDPAIANRLITGPQDRCFQPFFTV